MFATDTLLHTTPSDTEFKAMIQPPLLHPSSLNQPVLQLLLLLQPPLQRLPETLLLTCPDSISSILASSLGGSARKQSRHFQIFRKAGITLNQEAYAERPQ